MTRSVFVCPNNKTIGLNSRVASMAFVLLGAVQVTLTATITAITVALPTVQRDLHVDDEGRC
ncbi:hypothetical protein ACFY0A_28845 [Streptomyces sp. NPDC001698]|uniref:hypothetical protein n=1 Tax=Streptomyces sp. NPDC001698 TaxID=3364601 RepID=UPI003685205D